jgi:hypothetical protein
VITGDDYGYWPSYNDGIIEAIEMGALDCVSAMVERDYCDPKPLLQSGVEIGLHIEFEGRWGPRSGAPARTALQVQLDRFVDLFGRWPSSPRPCSRRPSRLASRFDRSAPTIGNGCESGASIPPIS